MQKVIVRTSQPLCGPQFRRCREDERMFAAILGKDRRGFIIDTRTQVWQIKLIYVKVKLFWGGKSGHVPFGKSKGRRIRAGGLLPALEEDK